MSRLVIFRGHAHRLPNDSQKADPVPGVWYVGEPPQYLPETVPRFTELVFDKALAEHCGRSCGPDCQGDCFAEMYTAVANINDARVPGRKKDEHLFDCLPWPPEPAPIAPPDAPNPAPTDKPLKRAARAARSTPHA